MEHISKNNFITCAQHVSQKWRTSRTGSQISTLHSVSPKPISSHTFITYLKNHGLKTYRFLWTWIVDFTHQHRSHMSKTDFVTCLNFEMYPSHFVSFRCTQVVMHLKTTACSLCDFVYITGDSIAWLFQLSWTQGWFYTVSRKKWNR